MSNFKKTLDDIVLCLTDKVLYFPCISNRPKIEYPNTSKNYTNSKLQSLIVATDDRTYNQIIENIYEALSGYKLPFKYIGHSTKKLIYDKINNTNQRIDIQKIINKEPDFNDLIDKYINEFDLNESHHYSSKINPKTNKSYRLDAKYKYVDWKIDNL